MRGQRIGFKHTQKVKDIISSKLKGRKMSEEQKQQISETLKGHIVTEETKRLISASLKKDDISKKHYYCNTCNKEIYSYRAINCKQCNNILLAKIRYKNHIYKIKKVSGKMKYIQENITRDILYNLYIIQRKSIKQIAKNLKVGSQLISKKLHYFKISIRDSNNRYKENNPAWKGGYVAKPYTKDFNNIFKKNIKERDNFECVICKNKNNLAIHHIDYNKELSIKENCITLCPKCHSKTNFNRNQWLLFFHSYLNENLGYEYENGKILLNLKEIYCEINNKRKD